MNGGPGTPDTSPRWDEHEMPPESTRVHVRVRVTERLSSLRICSQTFPH